MVLVPFTNVMRIGQGFNSYTQACCIDQAVTFTPIIKPRAGYTQPTDASTSTANDVATTSTILPGADPERVSQKVAYTCTFVQNMSEIAKELNVSAALCIKKGSLDASGSGQYIDEEQVRFHSRLPAVCAVTHFDLEIV